MIKLQTYLDENSLFTEIENINPFPFIADAGVENLDLLLGINFGERAMNPKLIELEPDLIAWLLITQYDRTWDNYIEQGALLISPNVKREITETIDTEENRISSSNNTEKTAAYNSEVMIDTGGRVDSDTGDTTGSRQRVLLDELIDPNKAYRFLQNSVKNDIIKLVLGDIARFTTLAIY